MDTSACLQQVSHLTLASLGLARLARLGENAVESNAQIAALLGTHIRHVPVSWAIEPAVNTLDQYKLRRFEDFDISFVTTLRLLALDQALHAIADIPGLHDLQASTLL